MPESSFGRLYQFKLIFKGFDAPQVYKTVDQAFITFSLKSIKWNTLEGTAIKGRMTKKVERQLGVMWKGI